MHYAKLIARGVGPRGDSRWRQCSGIGASPLGQYVGAHEDTSGVPKCKGLCRPIFEHKTNSPSGAAGFHLESGAPTGTSALWLFAAKKIEVPAGGFVFLG